MASSTRVKSCAPFSGQSAPEAEAQARSCGQPSRGLTRRSSESPKFAITRATAPMFSANCGAFKIMTGVADTGVAEEASAMARCRSQRRPSASLPRREVLIGAAALAVSGCRKRSTLTASRTPVLDVKVLDREVRALAERARPGILGFGLMNLESGQMWTLNSDRPFPMQSVFKMLVGAAALSEVDGGRLSLGEVFQITELQLSPPRSP